MSPSQSKSKRGDWLKNLSPERRREFARAGGRTSSADRQFMSEIGRMGGLTHNGDVPLTMRERAMKSARHLRHETHRLLWVRAWMAARNEIIDELKAMLAQESLK